MLIKPQLLPTDKSGRYVRSLWLASSQEDIRPGFLVIGMNFSVVEPCDSDTIRMNALQTTYPLTRVWGVSVHKGEDTPTWMHGDVRSPRFWARATLQNTKLFVVDYRWCPSSYWESSSNGLGYGDQWFSTHIPTFFEGGGQVCFLPNDTQGLVRAMYERHTQQQTSTTILHCEIVLASANPLYHATDVAWCQSNGDCWVASVPSSRANNYSHGESLRYCDRDWPFLMCYNRRSFSHMNSVKSWMRILRIPTRSS